MPTENYNEYKVDNSEAIQSEIDAAINFAKWDLNSLQSEILWWKKVDFKTPDSINHFYELDKKNWKVIFKLDQVKKYLDDVYKRLSWMKVQKFSETSKENNFTWTILAIQIALKALETDPKNPQKYNVGKINGNYNSTIDAIKNFQSKQNMKYTDGKPWKDTIWAIIKSLETLLNNKKEYNRIKNIVKGNLIWKAWILDPNSKADEITNYIIKWNLWSNKNPELEKEINNLATNPLNDNLRKIVEEYKEDGKLKSLNKQDPYNKNKKYDEIIIKYSKEYSDSKHKIDPALIKIIMNKESKFNPKARSGAGAKWLMQLMPISVKEVNKEKIIVKNVYDPKQNIEWWIKLFSKYLKTFKWDISLALAAYNAGVGKVKKAWNRIPNRKETKKYVNFIINEYNKLRG